MGIGDSSSELSLNALTPSASLRADEGPRSPQQDAEKKVRRRRRDEQQESEGQSEDTFPDSSESPAHQLDRLA